MKKTRRRYVYEETSREVEEFAKKQNMTTPNFKFNFPFYLEEYLKSRQR